MYKKYVIVIVISSNFSHLHMKTQLEPFMPNEMKKHLIPIPWGMCTITGLHYYFLLQIHCSHPTTTLNHCFHYLHAHSSIHARWGEETIFSNSLGWVQSLDWTTRCIVLTPRKQFQFLSTIVLTTHTHKQFCSCQMHEVKKQFSPILWGGYNHWTWTTTYFSWMHCSRPESNPSQPLFSLLTNTHSSLHVRWGEETI